MRVITMTVDSSQVNVCENQPIKEEQQQQQQQKPRDPDRTRDLFGVQLEVSSINKNFHLIRIGYFYFFSQSKFSLLCS